MYNEVLLPEPTCTELRHVTPRRAEVLALLAAGATLAEVAAELSISLNGARSHVADLKQLTGRGSTRELGKWWLQRRELWVEMMSLIAMREIDQRIDMQQIT